MARMLFCLRSFVETLNLCFGDVSRKTTRKGKFSGCTKFSKCKVPHLNDIQISCYIASIILVFAQHNNLDMISTRPAFFCYSYMLFPHPLLPPPQPHPKHFSIPFPHPQSPSYPPICLFFFFPLPFLMLNLLSLSLRHSSFLKCHA